MTSGRKVLGGLQEAGPAKRVFGYQRMKTMETREVLQTITNGPGAGLAPAPHRPDSKCEAPPLTEAERNLLVWCADWFLNRFRREFVTQIQAEFPQLEHLREIVDLEAQIQGLIRTLTGELESDGGGGIESRWGALIKRIVLTYRLEKATELEKLREKTSNLEILERLDGVIKPLDDLVARRWFQQTTPLRMPRLWDYLDLERIEKKANQEHRLAEREYDEKFHILQAPSLFLRDLNYYREKCALRASPVAVAFLDIDEFKVTFNTRYGETKVDRNVLPRFMRCLEAHVAFHGHAYRQGGDEYLILLPGLSKELAVAFLDELRRKLGQLDYPEVTERTTVSIGLCVADPDCPLTDRELREKANQAEAFAKRAGRNCIASYRSHQLANNELYVAAPVSQ
jgi:diguanylate cyclase (GGDEF)-like protein